MLSRKRNRPGRRAAPASRSHDVSHVAQTHCPSAAKRSVAVCRSGTCALRIVRCTRLSVPRCLLTAVARSVARMGSCCSAPIGTAGCWHTTPCFYVSTIKPSMTQKINVASITDLHHLAQPQLLAQLSFAPSSREQVRFKLRQMCANCCAPIVVRLLLRAYCCADGTCFSRSLCTLSAVLRLLVTCARRCLHIVKKRLRGMTMRKHRVLTAASDRLPLLVQLHLELLGHGVMVVRCDHHGQPGRRGAMPSMPNTHACHQNMVGACSTGSMRGRLVALLCRCHVGCQLLD
jgi:hypothetical protein